MSRRWEAITINRLQRACLEARHRSARSRRWRTGYHNWSRSRLFWNSRRRRGHLHDWCGQWCRSRLSSRGGSTSTPPNVDP